VNGDLQIDDGAEDPAFQSAPGKLGKEDFHRVEPRARGRREVEDEALVPVEPSPDLRMLVDGVVVEDDVDDLTDRHFGFDRVQEPNELLMPMALHVAADDGSVENVEG